VPLQPKHHADEHAGDGDDQHRANPDGVHLLQQEPRPSGERAEAGEDADEQQVAPAKALQRPEAGAPQHRQPAEQRVHAGPPRPANRSAPSGAAG
jgi:hypothetical protein